MKIKKDKYFRKRGGKAKITKVICAKCKNVVLIYQKDGSGWLKRCYLNRIIEPEIYAILSKDKKEPRDLENLVCKCGAIIGSPIKHKDGRLAFHLTRGNFKRMNSKQQ